MRAALELETLVKSTVNPTLSANIGQMRRDGDERELRHAVRNKPVRRSMPEGAAQDRASALWSTAFCVLIGAILLFGLQAVVEHQITPKEGFGYYIGIVGASLMLSLLLYPARKHMKLLQAWGTVSGWFLWHMMLGIIGPALIVVHSGFAMTSRNGTVAMLSMLLVVASGIVGRYVYSRLHVGLYGRRAEVQELIKDIEKSEASLAIGSELPIEVLAQLRSLAHSTLAMTKHLSGSLAFRMARGERRALKRKLHTEIESSVAGAALKSLASPSAIRQELDKTHEDLDVFFMTVEQIGSVRFYERIFHAWHLFHLPLFLLLILTAVLHIIAVHLY